MSRSRALCLALLLCAPLGAATSLYDEGARQNDINSQRARIRGDDSQELRSAIDETQVLFNSLAAESSRQDKEAVKGLLKDLRTDYKLPDAEKRAGRALELSEDVIAIQAGIKQQQARLKDAAAGDLDAEEQRLLGMQSDLLGAVDDLRKTLRSLHKDLKEEGVRDLRNWAMVSEGLLRRRREAAEAEAERQKAAEGLPLDAGQVLPAALSPTAVPQP